MGLSGRAGLLADQVDEVTGEENSKRCDLVPICRDFGGDRCGRCFWVGLFGTLRECREGGAAIDGVAGVDRVIVYQSALMQLRSDPAGDGSWQASRDGGKRKHNGIDLTCNPGGILLCPVDGQVTKLGYAYEDDLSWRYVQITDRGGLHHRFFYVDPWVEVGDVVTPLASLGVFQNVAQRYRDPRMTPHLHYEVKNQRGKYIKPEVQFSE